MKRHSANRRSAMTLMEVAVVLAILAIFAAIAINGTIHEQNLRARVLRVQCVNNLKQIWVASRLWVGDNTDKFPFEESPTNGGTKDFVTGPNAWRHFQVMSNELGTPKILICPADTNCLVAPNFISMGNSNLSFFVGIDADPASTASILSGDRNITNAIPLNSGVLEATVSAPAHWTSAVHDLKGNLLFADGSVRRSDGADLSVVLAKTGLATNHLQMPVTFP